METAFYEDHMQMSYNSSRDDLRKRLTLDLNSPRLAKKPRFDVLLSSPDLHMLKLASPELDKLIMQQNGLVTSTPTPGQFLFPKSVTQEQELYARGFVEALAELHQQNEHNASAGPNASQINPTSTTSSAGLEIMVTSSAMAPSSYSTYTYTTLGGSGGGASHSHLSGGSSVAGDSDSNVSRSGVPAVPGMIPISSGSGPSAHYESQMESSFAAMVKEEPLTVSTTPPMSPIDMESQERIKLERKRQRNRVAASKCRRRKLERIAKLEDKVRQLKNENSDLAIVMHKLRDQVCSLKQQVMEHYNSGCQIVLNSQF